MTDEAKAERAAVVAGDHSGERAATLTSFQREVLAGDWLKLPFRDRLDTVDELVALGLARWRDDDAFGLRLTDLGLAVRQAITERDEG